MGAKAKENEALISKGFISLASYPSEELGALRRREYGRTPSFSVVNPDAVDWTDGDDNSIVLAAWDEKSTAIATMRAQILWSLEELEDTVESEFSNCNLTWPVMALSRAATDRAYQEVGLNSVLRFYFFSFALSWHVAHVVGAVYVGSPRTQLMAKLGYEFYSSANPGRDCLLVPKGTSLSAVLDLRTSGEKALQILRDQTSQCFNDYPWCGDIPDRPW